MLISYQKNFSVGFSWLGLIGLCLASISCSKTNDESNASLIASALLSADQDMPASLLETNLFNMGNPDRPVAGVVPYDVKVPLWSDGARKQRYIFVPPGEFLHLNESTGKFDFPTGTTLIKHFATEGNPAQPIETRILTLKDDKKWHFATYVWNDDATTSLSSRPHKVTKHDGEYRIPSESECKMCHGESGDVLGFTPKQLNYEDAYRKNQYADLSKKILFASTPTDLSQRPALDDPTDQSLSIQRRARAYLDVNCSTCHRPDGPDKANKLDMRLETIDTKLVSEGKIVPGKPDKSILWQRITATTDRMPYISLRTDPLALDVLRAYISQWSE